MIRMIQVIFGEKGAGKTKRIIRMANDRAGESRGSLLFVDDDSRYMFDLKHQIRFIDASEYGIDGPKMFYGFICGLAAQDFDLEAIFIDGFLRIVRHEIGELSGLFEDLEAFSEKLSLDLVFSITGNPDTAPDYIKRYFV